MKTTPLQLELTRLIGKKEGHSANASPATLSDFHRWMNDNCFTFEQEKEIINIGFLKWGDDGFQNGCKDWQYTITYDSSKDLLEQSDNTLKQILELIKSNKS